MRESNALTRQFDEAACYYDEVRPRDPETIVEQIMTFAGLPPHGHRFEARGGKLDEPPALAYPAQSSASR